jgi:hypothetical protein
MNFEQAIRFVVFCIPNYFLQITYLSMYLFQIKLTADNFGGPSLKMFGV